jgi:hypothetical protein
MFIFDPTQDVRFRQRLAGVSGDPQLAAGTKTTRQDQLLVEMARRIRIHAGLSPQERVPKPLFVILSKSDIWAPLLKERDGTPMDLVTPPYSRERAGLGKVSIQRVDRVSDAIRELLMNLAPELVAVAEDAFERVIFVPVSAIGTSPVMDPASGLLKVPVARISPRWVTVPFMYTLARWSTHLVANDKSASGSDSSFGEEPEPMDTDPD